MGPPPSSAQKKPKTYNSGYSLVVTHLITNPPVRCLNRAEQTECLVFNVLWSYVEEELILTLYIANNCERGLASRCQQDTGIPQHHRYRTHRPRFGWLRLSPGLSTMNWTVDVAPMRRKSVVATMHLKKSLAKSKHAWAVSNLRTRNAHLAECQNSGKQFGKWLHTVARSRHAQVYRQAVVVRLLVDDFGSGSGSYTSDLSPGISPRLWNGIPQWASVRQLLIKVQHFTRRIRAINTLREEL